MHITRFHQGLFRQKSSEPLTLQVTVSETGSHGDQFCDIQRTINEFAEQQNRFLKKNTKVYRSNSTKNQVLVFLSQSFTPRSMALVNTEERRSKGRPASTPPTKPPVYFYQTHTNFGKLPSKETPVTGPALLDVGAFKFLLFHNLFVF